MSVPYFLPEKEWRTLIRDIGKGNVLPVIGPELVTVIDPQSGQPVPLYRHLAPQLALKLKPDGGLSGDTVNEVACQHLLRGGSREDIFIELDDLLKAATPEPNDALLALARIKHLKLFISSTFDRHLAVALEKSGRDFRSDRDVLRFHPNEAADIPKDLTTTKLYHIFGDHRSPIDFAVWEEDFMEFICGLLKYQADGDSMPHLFTQLKNRCLLLLGAPFTDWVVRFFLRTARGARLSGRRGESTELLADREENLGAPLIFFFDNLIQSTSIIRGDPTAFVLELARRWELENGASDSDDDFLARIPDQMPKDSVFISYASEDSPAALRLARALHAEAVPVWLDKARLRVGQNFESELKNAVGDCSFFISLISPTTEADTERKRYFHIERDWIAQRHSDGYLYYLPVAIDATLPEKWQPHSEPPCFASRHYHRLPEGRPDRDFVPYVRSLIDVFRSSGRPRG